MPRSRGAIQDGTHGLVLEYRIITRSGEVRWVEEHALGLLMSNHRPTHYPGIILDITARKRAEAAKTCLPAKEVEVQQVGAHRGSQAANEETPRREITQRHEPLKPYGSMRYTWMALR